MRASAKAKAKKPAKFATGGATGAALAQRVADARARMAAYGAQARPIARQNIRPQFASNNLEAIKARLKAAGSMPGASTNGGNNYAPVVPPATTPAGTTPQGTAGGSGMGSNTGVWDDATVQGNKKGGFIKAKRKAPKKKA